MVSFSIWSSFDLDLLWKSESEWMVFSSLSRTSFHNYIVRTPPPLPLVQNWWKWGEGGGVSENFCQKRGIRQNWWGGYLEIGGCHIKLRFFWRFLMKQSVCLKLGVLTSLQTMNYSPCRKIENLLQFKECVFIQKVLLENFLWSHRRYLELGCS